MAKQQTALLVIFILGCVNIVKADWPVGKRRFNLSPTYSFSSTPRYFDADGKVRASANGGSYVTHSVGIYGSTGLSRRLDFYFNVPASYVSSSDIYTKQTKIGVGDVIAGLAFHTPSEDLRSYFTVKAHVIVPMYSNIVSPYLGYGSKGVQFAANYSFLPRKGNFAIIEGTVTRYFDQVDGPTQYGAALSYGFQLPKFQSLTFTFNHMNSISSNKIFSSNLNSNKDFMVGRLSGSYGKRISRTVTPYVQASYPFYGRNVGQGISISVFFSVWLP
jgi:hypothetical protein